MSAEIELEFIRSMLSSGHRCVRLERHSLLLWGLIGGSLCAFTDLVVTQDRFPDLKIRALALFCWLFFWLGGAAWLDHVMTKRSRSDRDETLPFVQAQITRAWWMLLFMGILGSVAMSFYGGGYMVYAFWTVLLGLGIYLFGLFSLPVVEWIGLAAILVGIAGLAAHLGMGTTKWLAADSFAIGLPLAGWMMEKNMGASLPGRTAALLFWLFLVISPALFLGVREAPAPKAGVKVVSLPGGSEVLLKMEMNGDLLAARPADGLSFTLLQPLEVAMKDGVPEGRFRFGAGKWQSIRDGVLDLRISALSPRLENGMPVVHAVASLKVSGR
ncbi:MAG: hypothetical protein HKL98_11165 [Burkholderiales bacterium]|nr:hypothetical protein [Burkholderiales bacterium]